MLKLESVCLRAITCICFCKNILRFLRFLKKLYKASVLLDHDLSFGIVIPYACVILRTNFFYCGRVVITSYLWPRLSMGVQTTVFRCVTLLSCPLLPHLVYPYVWRVTPFQVYSCQGKAWWCLIWVGDRMIMFTRSRVYLKGAQLESIWSRRDRLVQ